MSFVAEDQPQKDKSTQVVVSEPIDFAQGSDASLDDNSKAAGSLQPTRTAMSGVVYLGPSGEERLHPTDEEMVTLRKVRDKFPLSAFLVALVELGERFTYYGLSGPFQNYMQLPRANANQTGGIGLGKQTATGLSNYFQFWCYVTPIPGGIIADMYLGKYNTIFISAWIYLAGVLILFVTSLPQYMETAGLGGLATAMTIIGIGTGGIKSNVSVLIADQYTNTKPYIRVLKSGERVIVDPATTMQFVYEAFYMCINIGSLSAIATTELEAHVDFWAAYLLPFAFFAVPIAALILGKKYYIKRPPQGSPIPHAIRITGMAVANGFKSKSKRYVSHVSLEEKSKLVALAAQRTGWRQAIDKVVYAPLRPLTSAISSRFTLDIARPGVRAELGLSAVPWTDSFVDEVQRALHACAVFVYFPVYWVVYNQMLNNFVSQAGQMENHGVPNDFWSNLDPIIIIVFIPVMEYFVYPGLRRLGFPMLPVTRIFWGFVLGALAMGYAAICQKIIYSAAPCYQFPVDDRCAITDNDGNTGTTPNHVHVAVQIPAYFFIAFSEIFASITGLEYAYTKGPPSMKSFIMSLFLFTSAIGSALNAAMVSTTVNPKLLWMYTGLAVACFLAGLLFWFTFQSYNDKEFAFNMLDERLEEEATDPSDPMTRHLGDEHFMHPMKSGELGAHDQANVDVVTTLAQP